MTGRWLGATLLYALLTVALTWPVTPRLTSHVPFYNDTWVFVWDLHWFREAALDPELALYETPSVFHPGGAPLAFHTLTPLNGLLALPLVGRLGLVASHNLLFLASFLLSALAMAALAHRVSGCWPGALLAGFLYAFSPFHVAHGYHLNLLSIQTLPLVALAWLAFLERPRWPTALACAGLVAASFYLCLAYGAFAALLMLLLAVEALVSRRVRPSRDLLGRAVGMTAVGTLLVLPGLVPALGEALVERYYFDPVDTRFSADLMSWFTPSLHHSVWGDYTMKVYQHLPGVLAEWTTYVGYSVLALGLAAILWAGRRRVRPWWLTALVFGLLAMGPWLQVLGRHRFQIGEWAFSVPLPYQLLKAVPVLNSLREPSRFAVLVTLATSVLAACGIAALAPRLPGPLRRPGRLAALVFVLALIEFVPLPLPTTAAVPPTFLGELGAEAGDFAVLHAPGRRAFREHLYYQALHGKRLFDGYMARIPASSQLFLETLPLARDPALWDLERIPAKHYLAWARRYDVRYALVFEEFYRRDRAPESFPRAVANLLALPGARVVAEEPGFVAVRLPVGEE